MSSRSRPTTLDIPGLTRSKVSPDGRIAQRDVGAKLVIVMVGLPARGKSYITKKIARYLNWLQHDTRIFNVGERRRVAAGPSKSRTDPSSSLLPPPKVSISEPIESNTWPPSSDLTLIDNFSEDSKLSGNAPALRSEETQNVSGIDQSANFFDPENAEAVQLREEVALATLDELLDYILDQNGSVGIFDATNSTLERRKRIMERVRQRAGPEIGVLFVESLCVDENV